MKLRKTEVIAREDIFGTPDKPGYLTRLTTLCSGEPTVAELEEAHEITQLLSYTLRSWRSSVRLIQAAPRSTTITRQEIDEARRTA